MVFLASLVFMFVRSAVGLGKVVVFLFVVVFFVYRYCWDVLFGVSFILVFCFGFTRCN